MGLIIFLGLVIWIISIIISGLCILVSMVEHDKNALVYSWWFFVLMILTGYLTFIPLVVILSFINKK